MRVVILLLLVLLVANACTSTKRLVYLSDLPATGDYRETISNKVEPKIQSDDLLSITVGSLNPESNVLFNNGVLQTLGGTSSAAATTRTNEGYSVDKEGNINFPVLGKVHLAGLTKEQATEELTTEIKKSVKNPIVNIKFLNFRITVLGEVNRPSTFTIPSERVNLLEAIGLAGDLTVYGKRDNILIIRERDGVRSTTRINLMSKSTLESSDYYLQQNDIVYVEPAKIKALQSGTTTFYLTFVTLGISLISILAILR